MSVPGLAGVELGTASGMSIALTRGPGGPDGAPARPQGQRVVVDRAGRLARRGGILGEGIRQALLRDPTYLRALKGGPAMLGAAAPA